MMEGCDNRSSEDTFHILAFPSSEPEQIVLFIGVSVMYVTAVLGNLTITVLICLVPQLHRPMYFFLCNLSIVDITYVSTILPKLLSITLMQENKIAFQDCITQQYFFILCLTLETLLLTCMAYDRFVAICKPLRYTTIMNNNLCVIMTVSSWLFGAMNALLHALLTSRLSFCFSMVINHFFCDLKTMIHLSSSNTKSRVILLMVEDILIPCTSCLLIITSYVYIISTILKIRSSEWRLKTFSQCASHLTTVILFYAPAIFLYLKSESEASKEQDKLLTMFYVGVVPMLNPIVYSLRNKEVLGGIAKLVNFKRIVC